MSAPGADAQSPLVAGLGGPGEQGHGPEQLDGIGHHGQRTPAIELRGLGFRYPDGPEILVDLNLYVEMGATLVIIGPNGGGKTTLLKILLGLLQGYRGEVRVAGLPPREARARRNIVAWVPQRSAFNWSFPATLQDAVAMGLIGRTGMWRRPGAEDQSYLQRVLAALEISHLARRSMGELSGGQQQRGILARALVSRPRILLLDEPTVGVDATGKQRLAETLETVKREFGVTLVLVSHDLRTALSSARRVACLNRRLHFHDASEKLTSDILAHTYGCDLDGILPAACNHDGGPGGEP